jgi:opacity protein-like surface antigen
MMDPQRSEHLKRIVMAVVASFAMVAGAEAQTFGPRGYVGGLGGMTFGTETDVLFGGEFGGNVSDNLQIYGGFGRLQNILPKSVQDDLDDASQALTFLTGLRWEFSAKAPAWYGTGGAKFMIPTRSQARPYLLGGAGFARVNTKIKEVDFGDITNDLISEGYLDEGDVRATKLMVEFGGGVDIPVSIIHLDLGYRFRKPIGLDVNISQLQFGFGVGF